MKSHRAGGQAISISLSISATILRILVSDQIIETAGFAELIEE
jgi:hypothetical protein